MCFLVGMVWIVCCFLYFVFCLIYLELVYYVVVVFFALFLGSECFFLNCWIDLVYVCLFN